MTSISALDFRRFIEKVEQRKYIHTTSSRLFRLVLGLCRGRSRDDDFVERSDVDCVDWVESVGDDSRSDRLVVFSDGEALSLEYRHPIHCGQLSERRIFGRLYTIDRLVSVHLVHLMG